MKLLGFYLIAAVYAKCLPHDNSRSTKTPMKTVVEPPTCLVRFEDQIYDFQGWITVHPGGGPVIQGLCGKTSENQMLTVHADFQDQLRKANVTCNNCITLV